MSIESFIENLKSQYPAGVPLPKRLVNEK